MKTRITSIWALALLAASCNFLDPLENGSYNEDNYKDYPEIIRGFVDKAYNLRPNSYNANEFMGSDAAADNAVYRSQSNSMRLFSIGSGQMTSNPFSTIWTRSYKSINYCNLFLEDNIGINTHYLLDAESDMALRRSLQGDAYAMRAWSYYELLRTFGGMTPDGQLMGVPILTKASHVEEIDLSDVSRATYDETVAQILEDCDSAYAYLPLSNRDYPGDKVYVTPVLGSVRYRCFDRVAVDGLRAMTYLMWASPAFNASDDMSRYEKAAEFASSVLKHKLDVESALGFNPYAKFTWGDINSPEIILPTNTATSSIEGDLYPQGFGGSASIAPTEDLAKAFPMANGYPITDSRSGFNPESPYAGRDPRFYAAIFHHGSDVVRNTNSQVMYTFNMMEGAADAPGGLATSPSGYYQKKFVYLGYNPYDETPVKGFRTVMHMRWEQMCLIFAEAAAKIVSPTDASRFGISARDALAYLRARATTDGVDGLGKAADPYLDECAADASSFEALVKNERRITTCFEGMRFYDLRRWSRPDDLSAINVPVHGVAISSDGKVNETEIETREYPSLWCPLPYTEVRKCPNLQQNAGWENWK